MAKLVGSDWNQTHVCYDEEKFGLCAQTLDTILSSIVTHHPNYKRRAYVITSRGRERQSSLALPNISFCICSDHDETCVTDNP